MTDFRRTLLWVVFSMSLVLIWDAWNKHSGQPSLFASPAATKSTEVPKTQLTSSVAGLPTPTVNSAVVDTLVVTPQQQEAASERIVITTDLMKATFDTKGADLVRVELLKQADPQDSKENMVLLDQSPERLYLAQTGLVPATGGSGLPNHHTVMTLLPGERTLAEGQSLVEVKFESPLIGGVRLLKTFTFKRGDYVVDVINEVINDSGAVVNPRLYLQLVRDGNAPAGESSLYFTFTGPAVFEDKAKFQKVEFKSIEKRKPQEAPSHATNADNGWVAMVQHYFASAWLLDKANGAGLQREFFTGKLAPNTYSVGMLVSLGEIAPGAHKVLPSQLFVGPQEENKLAALAPGLELVKDYGWFTILAKPLFWLLTQLHKYMNNWGWAIVGLVVLLKAAFYWLNAKAYGSMAKMKSISPRVTAMRDRLKDKPQQMQQEMMRMYREEKINPLGGCLPIFAQMPFFIALYWVLLSSVEMRNAPWIGWITDLSAKDPYFILPLLMTATSLLQTWLNPTPPDPIQAKMMWIMPLLFSVMFFFFPAGLVLYWLTNNILSIAQQYLINKRLGVLGK
jgi:YidC/Oxa1 family membrane protein insertase